MGKLNNNQNLIVHVITSLDDGGAEAVLYRLIANDQINDHHVVSLSGSGKFGSKLEALDVGVTTLFMSPGRPSLMAFIRLVKLLRQKKPQVVQTWMYHSDLFGGLAARAAGIRNVVWGIHATSLKPHKSDKSTTWIVRLLAKLSWYVPKKIVVCAQRARDVHVVLGYDHKKINFIPNGYDSSKFRPDLDIPSDLNDELLANGFTPVIGTVARFDPLKDHCNLLDALAIVRDKGLAFRCLLVGAGLDPKNVIIVDWLAKRGLTEHVQLVGSRSDIPNIMNALDIHVLSSSSEAFPNAVAEAMACGTPCVVTDVGDSAFIVGNTGWVVPPRNPVALAEGIAKAITEMRSDNWQVQCDLATKRIVENFSIEKMVNHYNRIWYQH